jgi:phosphoesterase RecJ-like protein
VKLLGYLMSNLHIECGGRLAWFSLSKKELKDFGLLREETEEYITVPRSIASVEVIAFFSELEKNITRVSLRSKGRITIHEVATQFNGGGHAFAAGARTGDSLEKTAADVTKALAEKIRAELGPD